jgi:adenine deaminase
MVGLIHGFGITNGAIAGSVAHDCHNIVAVGSNDGYIVRAINRVIEMGGGLVVVSADEENDMALPVIPNLKLTDRHLMDTKKMEIIR